MLGSISPVGEAARRQRWWLTAGAYTLASIVGGAAVGTVLGAMGAAVGMGSVPSGGRLIGLAAVVAVGAALDARWLRWELPTWRRQVDERWLSTYRGWVYGAGFGFQLGAAVATIVPAAVTYTALAAALLSGSWQGGLVVGLVFGAVRSVPLLLTGRLRTAADLYTVTRRVERAAPLAHRITVIAQFVVAAAALAAAGIAA